MSINFKIEYETPRASVRGVFLLEGLMADVSWWPAIKAGTPEYYEFENYSDVQTQDGRDVAIF
jgi:hypothetical protein